MRHARRSTITRRGLLAVFILAALGAPSAARSQTPTSPPPPAPIDSTLPTVFHIGDSTMRNGSGAGGNGQWGWGDLVSCYYDVTRVNVVNRALGGRSSRTYLTQGLWDRVLAALKPGDVVIMQFGHNDGGALNDTSRARGSIRGIGEETQEIDNLLTHQHEVVHTFGWYIRKFIADTRAKGATPVVASLVPRNYWDNGAVRRNKKDYAGWAEEVARAQGAAFIDLNELIAREYDALGEEKVKSYFVADRTHTTLDGAKVNARVAVSALKGIPKSPVGAYLLDDAAALKACTQPPVHLSGSPEDHLPPQITQLTGFGERAVWSPDGKRVAFMEKSFGDAFEIDLGTRLTRLLTGHFRHAGFLRVHYLPNGDYFLIGARDFKDINTTRGRDQEMWVMKAGARTAPVPLGHKISEGVATSRTRTRIAWSNTHGQYPDLLADNESVLYMADIEYVDGMPRLANKRELLRARKPECTLEAQDFRHDDTELIYVCYRDPGKADVFGLDLKSGAITTYRKVAGEYNEVEGMTPDGQWSLVESSRDQGADRQNSRYIDLWKLKLEPNSTDFVRMTRWGDYDGYKASNPTVSPDGKWFAFQSARSNDPAGVGYGIFLYRLTDK